MSDKDFEHWEKAYEFANGELDDVESSLSLLENVKDDKSPSFILPSEKEAEFGSEQQEQSVLSQLYEAVGESWGDLSYMLSMFKEIQELNFKSKELIKELQLEQMRLSNQERTLKEKSERLKELLDTYKEQVNRVLIIAEKIPAENDSLFEKKLKLIDRANALLERISQLTVRLLKL